MDLLSSLTAYGNRIGKKPVVYDRNFLNVWCFDLNTGKLVQQKKATLCVPQPVCHGSNASSVPNHCYEVAKYALDKDAAFWATTKEIVAKNPNLKKAVEHCLRLNWEIQKVTDDGYLFRDATKKTHAVEPGDTIVLCNGTKPLAEYAAVQAWLQEQDELKAEEGKLGSCLITGKKKRLARLHLGIQGGSDKLVSFNERATWYRGYSYGENFPVSNEAAEAYSAALHSLLKPQREPASSYMLAKDTWLVLWPHEKKEHPIIPLAITILRGDKKEKLEQAWSELEKISKKDTTDICAALLKLRKIRYAVMRYEHIPVQKLLSSLLSFREEFNEWSFWSVSNFWLSSAKEVQNSIIFYALWSILTNEPYPQEVSQLRGRQVTDYMQERWFNAYQYRKGIPVVLNHGNYDPSKEPDPKVYLNQELVREKDPNYTLGRMIAIFCRMKQQAHQRNSISPGTILSMALANPVVAYQRMTQGTFHIAERLEKKNRNHWVAMFQELDSDYSRAGVNITNLMHRLTDVERALITQGCSNQWTLSGHFLAFLYYQKNHKGEKKPEEKTEEKVKGKKRK